MKTWLITGASSGLGNILTRRLLERGDVVAAIVRREVALDELAMMYGDQLKTFTADVTDVDRLRSEVEAAFSSLGRIDYVVSNAGYGLFGAIEEVSDRQVDRQIATNLLGSIHLIRAALPRLRKQGGGRIIQVSSEGGQTTYPGFGLYHASKWGVEGFIETLSAEVAPFGIECMIVEPGPTATGFAGNLDLADPKDDYGASPVGEVRRQFARETFTVKGDAERTVSQLIQAADSEQLPLRLALGSAAYERITQALERRLADIRAQKQAAYAADRTDV